ncbi:hypothetical protein FA95DRAFT_1597503 [Auriscalpium vulgare]|uniref:Uncharacterized protein n=1 Tax=Auriscalpium vulgare TaxID=40419 RepID=A0ACB8RJL7_9AGAM|nr:hypothetical protein FA95DRAFT_1597503 [Auriscalpium vulgare]
MPSYLDPALFATPTPVGLPPTPGDMQLAQFAMTAERPAAPDTPNPVMYPTTSHAVITPGISPFQPVPDSKLTKDWIIRESAIARTRIDTLEKDAASADSRLRRLEQEPQWKRDQLVALVEELVEARMDAMRARSAEVEVIEGAEDEDVKPIVEGSMNWSSQAVKHSKILKVTQETFFKFLGVPKLSEKDQFPVIKPDQNASELPFIQGSTTTRQIRLDWDNPGKSRGNFAALQEMAAFAKAHGGDYVSGAADLLAMVTLEDMTTRFLTKYSALQKVWRGTSGKQSTKPGGELTKTKRDNRAKGKLEVRLRKRPTAAGGASEWLLDDKYDAALTPQQMSDDEDTYDDNGILVPSVYTSRAPASRSDLLTDFFAALDAQADPKPSVQYARRDRGVPKEQTLPFTKTLEGRTRRWMVRTEWLAEHPECDTNNHLADNGVAWGDAKDPEDIDGTIASVKKEKAEKTKRKRDEAVEAALSGAATLKGDTRGKKQRTKHAEKAQGAGRGELTNMMPVAEADPDDDGFD